jgi:hypothetical protein
MPTSQIRTNNSIDALPHGKNLEQSAIEHRVRAMQADPAAGAEILRRTGGRDAGEATLPAGVIAARAKNLFGQLRARAAGAATSPGVAEPTYHPDDPSHTQAGLVPRHMRRASDVRRKAEAEAEYPVARPDEPQPRVLWSLREIVPSIDFETSDLRRRIEATQHGIVLQAPARLPALLMWPILAGICLCVGDILLGW